MIATAIEEAYTGPELAKGLGWQSQGPEPVCSALTRKGDRARGRWS